jgi:very-short-patch-repair endonuclease/predicted transcriptional regulator of viral defense system
MGRELNQLLRLAAKQFGVFWRDQAISAGITKRVIDGRVRSGEWVRILPRVYRLASAPETWEQLLMAAVLWAGECVVSHRSAARLHRLEGVESDLVEITTTRVLRSAHPNIAIHRYNDLEPRDLAWVGVFRTTTPTRTLIDLGSVCDEATVEHALEDALRRRLTTVPRLERRLAVLRRSGRRGVLILEKILRVRGLQPPTASGMETRLARLLRKGGIPQPQRQCVVTNDGKFIGRVDFAYPERKLAIEFDSAQFHEAETDRPNDCLRANDLMLIGWRTVHVTWYDLKCRPAVILAQIKAAYEAGPTLFVAGHPSGAS